LLQRFALLGQEAHVLDGDHGLIGKGFHQRDLAVGEGTNLVAVDHEHANQLVRLVHRHCEHGPVGVYAGAPVRVFWVVLNIEIVHGAPFEGGTSGVAVAPRRNGIALEKVAEFPRDVVASRKLQKLPIEAENEPALCSAKPHRALRERLEYRL
jgi:hypothetical protein